MKPETDSLSRRKILAAGAAAIGATAVALADAVAGMTMASNQTNSVGYVGPGYYEWKNGGVRIVYVGPAAEHFFPPEAWVRISEDEASYERDWMLEINLVALGENRNLRAVRGASS